MTTTPTPPSGPPLPDWDELERRLARRPRRRVTLPNFRESAVLVLISDVQAPSAGLPIDAAPPEPELLFIVRTASLPTHAGQIACPGGKRELTDATLTDTALRETTEEVGIPAAAIRVLGLLDDVATPMGFVITPVVGLLRGPLALRVHEGEVAATFTAALRGLPATYRSAGQADWLGYRYTMHEFLYGEYRIWGATAAIALQLLDTLSLLAAPPRDPEAIR
jgi:8-oxo-dGTP pyrophosphatase MutT (NUDIX family)